MRHAPRLSIQTLLALLVTLWLSGPKLAMTAPPTIPEPLKPWVPWVMEAHDSLRCPVLDGSAACIWPGQLKLEVLGNDASFSLEVQVDREIEVPLPGGKGSWPQQVKLDGQPLVVGDRSGMPVALLPEGTRQITGVFRWIQRPSRLKIPGITGRILLTVDGVVVPWPKLEQDGALRLGEGEVQAPGESRLELDVSRRIQDGVPTVITTRVTLRASGPGREVNLGAVLVQGSHPVSLTANLPARFSDDEELIVQVRPGAFELSFEALINTAVRSLEPPPMPAPWPDLEYWAVASNDRIRTVTLSGPAGVDPARTPLPEDWRSLTSYLMRPGEPLIFTQIRRGEPDPAPNQITLDRELWLDVDGGGLTVRDRIQGAMNQGWRMNVRAPMTLGHVEVGGEPQVITQDQEGHTGIELRQATLNVLAESRIDRWNRPLPAVGWDMDVQRLHTTVHLPPGWALIAVSGVDKPTYSLIDQWTLFDLFFVLIMGLSIGKLFGFAWGLATLLGLALSRHEPDAPQLIWVCLLAVVALLRVARGPRWPRFLTLVRGAMLITLAVMLLPFFLKQVRTGLYPVLGDRPSYYDPGPTDRFGSLATSAEADFAGGFAQEEGKYEQKKASRARPRRGRSMLGDLASSSHSAGYRSQKKQFLSLQQDPAAVVQTGPGVPNWSWTRHKLGWTGSVNRDHALRLWLSSPRLELILNLLRVLLLLMLALRLGDIRLRGMKTPATVHTRWLVLLGLAGGMGLTTHPIHAAPMAQSDPSNQKRRQQAPNGGLESLNNLNLGTNPEGVLIGPRTPGFQGILNELERRLIRPPTCRPHCVTVTQLTLRVVSDRLVVDAEVHAEVDASWPIPGPARTWVPEVVLVNGVRTFALARLTDGLIHVRLEPGVHTVRAVGPLPPTDALTLQLGLAPKNVQWQSNSWTLSGLHPDGTAERALQLTRLMQRSTADVNEETRSTEHLAPWLEVHRSLDLGIPWRVQTEVVRLGPASSPVSIRVPLLPGEAVTDEGLQVEEDSVRVTLDSGQRSVTWLSTLAQRENLELVAPEKAPWTEHWNVSCSVVYACTASGIPPIRHVNHRRWSPEWRPWPGERISLSVSRPKGLKGQTLTINQAHYKFSPGQRMAVGELTLTITTSRGGNHILTLPEGARLQEVQLDNHSQPVQAQGREVPIPLKPGQQTVLLRWQQPRVTAVMEQMPAVNLGAPAVNTSLEIVPPQDRWILFVRGPGWGPVVLLWSHVFVILLLAFLLARAPHSPLRTHQWALLGLGMLTLHPAAPVGVVAWFFALEVRRHRRIHNTWWFLLVQAILVGLTLGALGSLYATIQYGLVSDAPSYIEGNGSSAFGLSWFLDRTDGALAQPLVVSVPLLVWRVTMLLWSLWLAASLVRWLPRAWQAFSVEGLWRSPIQQLRGPRGGQRTGRAGAPQHSKHGLPIAPLTGHRANGPEAPRSVTEAPRSGTRAEKPPHSVSSEPPAGMAPGDEGAAVIQEVRLEPQAEGSTSADARSKPQVTPHPEPPGEMPPADEDAPTATEMTSVEPPVEEGPAAATETTSVESPINAAGAAAAPEIASVAPPNNEGAATATETTSVESPNNEGAATALAKASVEPPDEMAPIPEVAQGSTSRPSTEAGGGRQAPAEEPSEYSSGDAFVTPTEGGCMGEEPSSGTSKPIAPSFVEDAWFQRGVQIDSPVSGEEGPDADLEPTQDGVAAGDGAELLQEGPPGTDLEPTLEQAPDGKGSEGNLPETTLVESDVSEAEALGVGGEISPAPTDLEADLVEPENLDADLVEPEALTERLDTRVQRGDEADSAQSSARLFRTEPPASDDLETDKKGPGEGKKGAPE